MNYHRGLQMKSVVIFNLLLCPLLCEVKTCRFQKLSSLAFGIADEFGIADCID